MQYLDSSDSSMKKWNLDPLFFYSENFVLGSWINTLLIQRFSSGFCGKSVCKGQVAVGVLTITMRQWMDSNKIHDEDYGEGVIQYLIAEMGVCWVPMKIKLNFFYQICDGKRVDTCAVFDSWILAYVLTCKSWMLEFWNTEFLAKVLTCRVIGRGWMDGTCSTAVYRWYSNDLVIPLDVNYYSFCFERWHNESLCFAPWGTTNMRCRQWRRIAPPQMESLFSRWWVIYFLS